MYELGRIITCLSHLAIIFDGTIGKKMQVEIFKDFFNLYSVDVRDMKDYPFNNKCKNCPGVYYPVCGDDNVTYINECKLHCLNKLKKKKVQVNMVRTGPCNVFPELNEE